MAPVGHGVVFNVHRMRDVDQLDLMSMYIRGVRGGRSGRPAQRMQNN